jgi:hypothetical protein
MSDGSRARKGSDSEDDEARRSASPGDLARRLKGRSRAHARDDAQRAASEPIGTFVRRSYVLPRAEAREVARDWLNRFPKAAYMTKVESWRQLDDDHIEFTMRRLPTAD